jgi:protein SCO1/2
VKKRFHEGFRLLTLSFDHREKAALGKAKRRRYRKLLNRNSIEWDFLVGSKENIKTLSQQVGFHFRYVAKKKQYAHPAIVFIFSPNGKLTQYLGMPFPSRDLEFSLVSASQGKLGSIFQRLIMSCFIYDSEAGQYTPFAFGVLRVAGVLTVFVIALMMLVFWKRERQPVEKLT